MTKLPFFVRQAYLSYFENGYVDLPTPALKLPGLEYCETIRRPAITQAERRWREAEAARVLDVKAEDARLFEIVEEEMCKMFGNLACELEKALFLPEKK